MRGDVLQVLGSMDSVEEACRKAGVRVESHDRMQFFLNAFVRVIAVESRHLARCRLVGVGDFASHLLPSALRSGRECSVETRNHDEPFGSPSWEWEDSVERPELQDLADEGVQELLHKAKYHRRNVEDSHSALQEMQARLAAETEERDHLSRVDDELDKRVVLQKLFDESPATVGLRCPLARTPVGDRGARKKCAQEFKSIYSSWIQRRQFSCLTTKSDKQLWLTQTTVVGVLWE